MTKLLIDEAVLRQALEALKEHAYMDGMIWCADCEEAITALRAAIEQQENVEPVAWMDKDGFLINETTHPQNYTPLYTLEELK